MSHHHTTTVHTAHGVHEDSASRQPWTVLALALVAQVLVVLDISVVNTALPTIGSVPGPAELATCSGWSPPTC